MYEDGYLSPAEPAAWEWEALATPVRRDGTGGGGDRAGALPLAMGSPAE